MSSILRWFASIPGWLTPPEWSAVASVGTLLVAVAAAVFAAFQTIEARRNRTDRTRPFVTVALEMDGFMMYFVVKNFGSSIARDVRVTSDIPLQRSVVREGEGFAALKWFDVLPVMVPGQEWRTFFDTGNGRRGQPELRQVYTATATYRGARGRRRFSDEFRLDWTTFEEIEFTTEKTVNDLAKTLEKIQTSLAKWGDVSGGLAVFTRDGNAADQARRARRDQQRAELQALNAQRDASANSTPPDEAH